MALENAETAEIIDLQDRSRVSEVLEALQLNDTVASLEERVASIELDLERLTVARDEDMRLFGGEMDVMRARIADALNAFAETEREIRDQTLSEAGQDAVARDVIAGVGDAMATMSEAFQTRIAAMDRRVEETRAAVERMATAVGSLLNRMDRLDLIGR